MKQCLLPNSKKKIWYELEKLLGKLNLVLLKKAKPLMRYVNFLLLYSDHQ